MTARLHRGAAAALPLSALRPAERNARGRAKTAARRTVEAVMAQSAVALTMEQITARAGLPRDLVRRQLVNICNAGMAYNTTPGTRTARYLAGQPPLASAPARPAPYVKPGTYDGADLRPYSARRGALDAFDKPSLEGGQAIERRPPISIASPVGAGKLR